MDLIHRLNFTTDMYVDIYTYMWLVLLAGSWLSESRTDFIHIHTRGWKDDSTPRLAIYLPATPTTAQLA